MSTNSDHGSLLDAFLLFGKDWKEAEVVRNAMTPIQNCNCYQKALPKVQKNGLIAHVQKCLSESKLADHCSLEYCESGILDNYNQSISRKDSSSSSLSIPDAPSRGSLRSSLPDLAEAYSFIGGIFDPDTTFSSEVLLCKLKEMDPVTARTVLICMRNLTVNISSPNFEPLRRCLSTYDVESQSVNHHSRCSCSLDA